MTMSTPPAGLPPMARRSGRARRASRALLGLGTVAATFFVLGDSCLGKQQRAKYVPGAADKVLNVEMSAMKPAIVARIDVGTRPEWVTKDRWERVTDLYKSYGNAPLWLEEGGAKARAAALLEAIRAAPEHGLNTSAYPIDAL